MPIDITGTDDYLASLLNLPLDNNNEPVTALQLRQALQRLLNNDVALERRGRKFTLSMEIGQRAWMSGAFPYVQLFYIPLLLGSTQRLRLIQGVWNLSGATGFQLHVGWGTAVVPFPTAGAGSTPYVSNEQVRESLAPINYFINNAGFAPANTALFIGVSTTATFGSVSSTPYPGGRFLLDLEVVG